MRVSRRRFLSSGAALLALPPLESLARTEDAPKRLVCVCTNFGLYGPAFFPEKPGEDYAPSEYMAILDGLRDKFTVFSGISHPDIGGDHASESSFLTSAKHVSKPGFRNSVSLDYVAAQQVGNATRFPFLSLSTLDGSPLTHTPSGAGVPALSKPSDIFARMFLAGRAQDVDREIERLRRGRSLLDRMGDRLNALRAKLGREDHEQIQDYVEAVREMEKRLHADEEWVKKPKPKAPEAAPSDQAERSDSIGRAKTMFHLTRLALQSDSTRVVSVFIRGMDERPPIAGISEGHHGLTHHGRHPGKIEQLKVVEKLLMGAFRDFLLALKSANLLESTQVLFGSNLGDASGHGTSNLPILLAGGGWKHGRHVAGDRKNNTPLGKLFVSVLRRFGVETDAFGSGKGTIEGLS